jgi:2,3-bisphosphoglycerate-independent phosphoglycerate mutase
MSDNNVPKPVVLVVIDGWGIAPSWGGNAITLASTPFFNMANKNYPHTTLLASGTAVGLPANERGNSEVGHLTIGSGQVVLESLPSITAAINDKSFYKSNALIGAFKKAKETGKFVHIIGLVSDGGIHSHIKHLYALLDMAQEQQCTNVCIHAITDGRDTPPFVSQEYLSRLKTKLIEKGIGRICTVAGRYYTMDRDHRWERIEKAYNAMVCGVGQSASSPEGAVASAYREGFSDEFIVPTMVQGKDNQYQPIQDGDSIIFFNFRGDRAREITQAIVKKDFAGFTRQKVLKDLYFVGFTFYQEGLPIEVAFKPKDVRKPLAATLSDNKLSQLHVAESEKYAHVTYFFNGGIEEPYKNEERIVVPSPKVPSYDQKPQMSSAEITKTVIENLDKYDFIVLNYACPDMVGHTGNLRATIEACEAVDAGIGQIAAVLKKYPNSVLIITSDHGNAEQKVNPKTGEPDTEHTHNPVPFYVISERFKDVKLRSGGGLSDVAPTILEIMGIAKGEGMTGNSLLEKPTA